MHRATTQNISIFDILNASGNLHSAVTVHEPLVIQLCGLQANSEEPISLKDTPIQVLSVCSPLTVSTDEPNF